MKSKMSTKRADFHPVEISFTIENMSELKAFLAIVNSFNHDGIMKQIADNYSVHDVDAYEIANFIDGMISGHNYEKLDAML